MKLAKEGFIHRDIELGKTYGKHKVIGFDCNTKNEMFICIEHEKYNQDKELSKNKYISIVLNGYEKSKKYKWVFKQTLLKLNY